jgi:hypothetical protein
MAIFNPELQSQPGFVSPARQVDIPNPPTPVPRVDTAPAIFQTLSNFATGFIEAGQRQGRGGAGSTADQFRGQFVEGLEIVESIREKQGLTAARLAEQKLASNFAGAGINLGEYKDTYETVTGRSFDQYGQDVGASMLDEAMKDPNVQANFLAASVALGPQSTSEERLSWAMQETSLQNAYAIEVGRSKREGAKAWGTRGEAAYVGILDGFLNQSVGQMIALQENGGRINPAQVSQLRVAWDAMKVELTAPQGVDADMFKPVGDKIAAIDTLVSTLEKASSSDQVLNELSFAIGEAILQEGGGSFESVLAAASAFKDPLGAAELGGFNWRENLMKLSGKTILEVNNTTLGFEIADQGGTEVLLKELPASIKTQVENLSPEQHLKNLEAGGLLTTMVTPNRMQVPEAQSQFAENTILMGATLMDMGDEEFLSSTMLNKLVGNPGFINNVKTLVTTNPEVGGNAKSILSTGLTREFVRQRTNLGSMEAFLEDKGIVWDGAAYVITPEAAARGPVVPGRGSPFSRMPTLGGMANLPQNVMEEYAGVIKQANDRRAAINVIDRTLTALGAGQTTQTQEAGGAGSQSAATANNIGDALGLDFTTLEAENGLPQGFLERTAFLESKGNPNAKNPSSSAGGLFQQTDGNAKDYGVADRFDPIQSTDGAVDFAVDNMRILTTALGREPTAAELYLAHQQGGSGARALLSNSDANVVDVLTPVYKGNRERAAEAVRLNGGNVNMTANEFASLWLDKFNNTKTTAPTAGRPQDANAVASRSGEAVQRAVTTPAGTSSAGMSPVEVSTASGGEVAVSVADGGAPVSGGTQGGAPLLDQAVAGQQGQTQEGEGGANAADPAMSAELQAFIEDLAANPDRAFATDEEFLVAQERGELEPGDAVVVNGVVYVIRKDGTPRRVGAVGS